MHNRKRQYKSIRLQSGEVYYQIGDIIYLPELTVEGWMEFGDIEICHVLAYENAAEAYKIKNTKLYKALK